MNEIFNLIYGILNYIMYFIPFTLFMIERNKKNFIKTLLSNEKIIFIGVIFVSFFFTIISLWQNKYTVIIYLFEFFIIYQILFKKLGSFYSMIISLMSIYATSILWEFPITIGTYLYYWNSDNYIILNTIYQPFKMLCIPLLFYYAHKFKNKKYKYNVSIMIPLLIFIILFYARNVEIGLMLRCLTASVFIYSSLTFLGPKSKG